MRRRDLDRVRVLREAAPAAPRAIVDDALHRVEIRAVAAPIERVRQDEREHDTGRHGEHTTSLRRRRLSSFARSAGPLITTTPATTAPTASESHAARVRESTSAAAHAASADRQNRAPLLPRALAMHQSRSGIPAAVRCAMKFRFPNVPPGARLSAANSIFMPYACASAVTAPITTTSASSANERPARSRGRRGARRPEDGRRAHGDRERAVREPVIRREERGNGRQRRATRRGQDPPCSATSGARRRARPGRPRAPRRAARVPSARRSGRGRTNGTAAPQHARERARAERDEYRHARGGHRRRFSFRTGWCMHHARLTDGPRERLGPLPRTLR